MTRTQIAGGLAPDLAERLRRVRLVAFDFDGVFTDNMVYVDETGRESVRCYRGDGLGLHKLQAAGVKAVIISTETNPVVGARGRKLGVRSLQGVEDKRAALETIAGELHLTLDQVAFVGNDVNDITCLEVVAVPIVVRDAHPDVLAYARFRTKRRGGHGAVREVCDLLVQVQADQPTARR